MDIDVMVEKQLKKRGISDERVLDAMKKVPRHEFVPKEQKSEAYFDNPVPIGQGQTISQPYMVAVMTELLELKGDEKVLEIGTGSGYQAAILAELAGEVISIERISELAAQAKSTLKELGYDVNVVVGDGTKGYEQEAPYDAIIVTAGAPRIPEALIQQLKDGGRLIIPVGDRSQQDLVRVVRKGNEFIEDYHTACRFVPLVGEHGW
ncbi:protein-L-isoaspartate(D-aspartate) O-methyltransferase [Nanoarchaeota archaeon]